MLSCFFLLGDIHLKQLATTDWSKFLFMYKRKKVLFTPFKVGKYSPPAGGHDASWPPPSPCDTRPWRAHINRSCLISSGLLPPQMYSSTSLSLVPLFPKPAQLPTPLPGAVPARNSCKLPRPNPPLSTAHATARSSMLHSSVDVPRLLQRTTIPALEGGCIYSLQ
jgi:hypothetical protein